MGQSSKRQHRVVVVEDERRVLARLCEDLPQRRPAWDISFAAGANAALVACEEASVAAVVIDLGALGAFGVQLLRDLRASHPDTACIVLAGRSGPERLHAALPLARHLTTKPFDLDELEAIVDRTLALRDRLENRAMFRLLEGGERLPTTPLFSELTRVVGSEDAGIGRLTEIVVRDGAILDRMLTLVNSSFFGLTAPVRDPRDAISILGATTLQALVLNLESFRAARESTCPGLDSEELRAHAFEAADLASRLVVGTNAWNHARVAALLHDIGRVVFGSAAPDEYGRVLTRFRTTRQPLAEIERQSFGFTHAELGAYAASLWGLPWTIVEPIAGHHDGSSTWLDEPFDARHAVYVAELALSEADAPEGGDAEQLSRAVRRWGLETELTAWRHERAADARTRRDAPLEDAG